MALNDVRLMLCDGCLDGVGGECHTPGCGLWMSSAPDVPIRIRVQAVGASAEQRRAAVDAVQEEFDERGLGDASLLVDVILDAASAVPSIS